MQKNRHAATTRLLVLLSAGSTLLYGILAFLIVYFVQDVPITSLFYHGMRVPEQLWIGAAAGLAGALFIGLVMFRTSMSEILQDYKIISFLAETRLSGWVRAYISFLAGFGEELLFRGALQPLLGIWITSAFFVALHGYFKFSSARHILFGAFMFFLSAGLGYLYESAGLIAAMTAHAAYDLVMLQIGHRYGFGKLNRAPNF